MWFEEALCSMSLFPSSSLHLGHFPPWNATQAAVGQGGSFVGSADTQAPFPSCSWGWGHPAPGKGYTGEWNAVYWVSCRSQVPARSLDADEQGYAFAGLGGSLISEN